MSPAEIELLLSLWAKAGSRLARIPAPIVAAPATTLPFRNERRLTVLLGDDSVWDSVGLDNGLVSGDTTTEPGFSLAMIDHTPNS